VHVVAHVYHHGTRTESCGSASWRKFAVLGVVQMGADLCLAIEPLRCDYMTKNLSA
jgi:hypothetical protein